jgi:hypothetical protein
MYVIYIPGLGDHSPTLQRAVVKTWHLYRVKPHFFHVGWADGEPFAIKLRRLLHLIDQLHQKDSEPVGIIAASAGVSLALHAYQENPSCICGVVSICGKINRTEGTIASIRRQNPSFSESMDMLPGTISKIPSESRKNVLCVYPIVDRIVPLQDQVLDGAHRRKSWTFGHVVTIAAQLTIASYRNIIFLKHHD